MKKVMITAALALGLLATGPVATAPSAHAATEPTPRADRAAAAAQAQPVGARAVTPPRKGTYQVTVTDSWVPTDQATFTWRVTKKGYVKAWSTVITRRCVVTGTDAEGLPTTSIVPVAVPVSVGRTKINKKNRALMSWTGPYQSHGTIGVEFKRKRASGTFSFYVDDYAGSAPCERLTGSLVASRL